MDSTKSGSKATEHQGESSSAAMHTDSSAYSAHPLPSENMKRSVENGEDQQPCSSSSKKRTSAAETKAAKSYLFLRRKSLDEEDCVLSLGEVQQLVLEQEELDLAAEALLGSADEHKCTYDEGYMKRQPLYACITCAKEKGENGGVCYACSLQCHDGHELVELYTKRLFRCDCGNDKLSSSCKLIPGKDPLNSSNKYDQNFNGLLCSCACPYPPTEDVVEDDLIQCCACEDWFHSRCLSDDGTSTISEEIASCTEIVCRQCAADLPFIRLYQNSDIPVEQGDENKCKLPESLSRRESGEKKMIVCNDQWRNKLCRCHLCMEMYSGKKCLFLLDEEDRAAAYLSTASGGGAYERDLALSQTMSGIMDPHIQRKMILGFNDMTDQLIQFLDQFKGSPRPVGPGDIHDFFAQLKRQKVNDDF